MRNFSPASVDTIALWNSVLMGASLQVYTCSVVLYAATGDR